MCTVTFWPDENGYIVGMNRDERLDREAGLSPSLRRIGGRNVAHPSEPSGGTWISLNQDGVTLALINWYAVSKRAESPAVSRGEVISACRMADSAAAAFAALEALSLERINPFRLIGIFPGEQTVREWRWNQDALSTLQLDWSPRQWISSGFDEPGAQRTRSDAFARCKNQADVGEIPWLRGLHGSHLPEPGPYSTCMHRNDATTVSYTEVEVRGNLGAMRHMLGTPCRAASFDSLELPVKNNDIMTRTNCLNSSCQSC
jgi:hypothetical protein